MNVILTGPQYSVLVGDLLTVPTQPQSLNLNVLCSTSSDLTTTGYAIPNLNPLDSFLVCLTSLVLSRRWLTLSLYPDPESQITSHQRFPTPLLTRPCDCTLDLLDAFIILLYDVAAPPVFSPASTSLTYVMFVQANHPHNNLLTVYLSHQRSASLVPPLDDTRTALSNFIAALSSNNAHCSLIYRIFVPIRSISVQLRKVADCVTSIQFFEGYMGLSSIHISIHSQLPDNDRRLLGNGHLPTAD